LLNGFTCCCDPFESAEHIRFVTDRCPESMLTASHEMMKIYF